MPLIDRDRSGTITKKEFSQVFEEYFRKLDIDPLKDLSFSLFSKIKQIIKFKGSNLMECFRAIDTSHRGFVDYESLERALASFGLNNMKPYHITTLLKLTEASSQQAVKEDRKKVQFMENSGITQARGAEPTTVFEVMNGEFKIYYATFVKYLMVSRKHNDFAHATLDRSG
jgi:Ca2+-binding EF-hand superfamily protein